MEYNRSFEKLLNILPDEREFVGLGNPNAKILFIGKECGSEIGSEIEHGCVKSWLSKDIDYSERYVPKEANVKNFRHTWQRYQKLYDSILYKLSIDDKKSQEDKYAITFVENVFTTELSNLPAKCTNDAKKQISFSERLKERKKLLFCSEFIQEFPIVLIFANDNKYIETYSGEICELFNVKFDRIYDYDGRDNIWIHYSIDSNSKLLIHTRQLTNSISKGLIDSISDIVVNFIRKNSTMIINERNERKSEK